MDDLDQGVTAVVVAVVAAVAAVAVVAAVAAATFGYTTTASARTAEDS